MVCRAMVKASGKRRDIKWCVVVESGRKWKRLSKRASLEDKENKGKEVVNNNLTNSAPITAWPKLMPMSKNKN